MRVVTAAQMRELEGVAIEKYGISEKDLMESAGLNSASVIIEVLKELNFSGEILVLAGKGNNGGDAFVVARHLIAKGHPVKLFTLSGVSYKGASLENQEAISSILNEQNNPIHQLTSSSELESYFLSCENPVLAIDALLGTGLRGPLSGIYKELVELVNKFSSYTVSLDLPSGVGASSGVVESVAIKADLTITMGFPKLGMFICPGARHIGEIEVVDISLPAHMAHEGDLRLLEPEKLLTSFKTLDPFTYKNTLGHCLLIGGSQGKMGAVVLASKGCLRTGVGLVTVATWEDVYDGVANKIPDEAMSISVSNNPDLTAELLARFKDFDSIVLGPGLGQSDIAKKLVLETIENFSGALVLDADALNLLSKEPNLKTIFNNRKSNVVLTPHPGELARLLGVDKAEILLDPVSAVKDAVELTESIVILKGPTTYVSMPAKEVFLNHGPNAGLAKAGSGDVLAGILGGLLAQGLDSFEGSQLGVYIHSRAGLFAADDIGQRAMSSSQISEYLPSVYSELSELNDVLILERGE